MSCADKKLLDGFRLDANPDIRDMIEEFISGHASEDTTVAVPARSTSIIHIHSAFTIEVTLLSC